MRVSYNWLKDYVDFDLTPEQLSEKLTIVGFEVEEVIETLPKFENIVVGKVKTCEKHPDADRLSLCEVELLDETFQVLSEIREKTLRMQQDARLIILSTFFFKFT